EGNAGDETNGSEATHTFTFTPSTTSIESVHLRYCTDPISDTCTGPTGLSLQTSPATLGTGTNDFTNDNLTVNSANTSTIDFDADTSGTAKTIVLESVVNPTVVGTFFVRVTTHSDDTPDTSGFLDMV